MLARWFLVLGHETEVDDSQFGIVVILDVVLTRFLPLSCLSCTIRPNTSDRVVRRIREVLIVFQDVSIPDEDVVRLEVVKYVASFVDLLQNIDQLNTNLSRCLEAEMSIGVIVYASQRVTHSIHNQIILFDHLSLENVLVYDIVALPIIIERLIYVHSNVVHLRYLGVRVLLVLNPLNDKNRLVLDTTDLLLLRQLVIVAKVHRSILDENPGSIEQGENLRRLLFVLIMRRLQPFEFLCLLLEEFLFTLELAIVLLYFGHQSETWILYVDYLMDLAKTPFVKLFE